MLEEKKYIDKIEIVGNNIQVREKILILKDNNVIASSFNRLLITKNDPRDNLDPFVIALAEILWDKDLTGNFLPVILQE